MHVDVDLPTAHDDGRFISAKVSRVVELIRGYDHRLDVIWIPPDMRRPADPAFAITEQLSDGRKVVAFYVQDEEAFNEDVLARIYLSDNQRNDVHAQVQAKNRAVEAIQAERYKEVIAAHTDLMASMIRSKKHTYRHNGRQYSL